jgi:Xaa-Pro dipeptidase
MKELEFDIAEYESRLAQAQEAMQKHRLDAVLITSEDHFRYFTGFHSPTWSNLTRPRYAVIPRAGNIILIVPTSNTTIVERTCWISDIRTWTSPQPEDDGISLVRDAIRQVPKTYGRVGAELGAESRLTMPVGDFLRLGKQVSPIEIVDAYPLLRRLLSVKSPAEIERIFKIAQIASASYETLPSSLKEGMTIQEACTLYKRDLLARGAESLPYVIGVAERYGYPCINLEPSGKTISNDDILIIDTAATYQGYFCDFNREFAFGGITDLVRRIYDVVWEATDAGIKASEPGRTVADVWKAIVTSLEVSAQRLHVPFVPGDIGRMGHGLGLRMCEPPSIASDDKTPIEVGTILTIEPNMVYHIEVDGERRRCVLVHEENIAITDKGVRLLTRRAPPAMPIIQ